MQVGIINGPNLNLLGQREKEIYGEQSFESYLTELKSEFPKIELDYFQSNVEGELINTIQDWGFSKDYILINAGGYTHTSVAIHDAIKAVTTPFIEVHISQPAAREEFRKNSIIASACIGTVSGFGLNSYFLALSSL